MNIAFIPVRGGSKSIPLKNIKEINGKPLVYWTVAAANNCKYIDKVYVSTDSDLIKNTVESFKFDKVEVVNRSEEVSNDTASTESTLLEFANKYDFDNVALVQATSPLLIDEDINRGFELFNSDGTDSVLSVVKQKRFHWDIDNDGIAHPMNYDVYNRPRRQEFDGYYVENGAFYITSKEKLMKSKNRVSGNIKVVEMNEDSYFEIDEPSDFVIIEAIMKNRIIKKELKKIKMFLTDCDGCLTDGGMYYSENGDELKKFNTKDGMGLSLLKEKGILRGIITGESVDLNRRRAEKLKLDIYKYGIKNKLEVVRELCSEYNISLEGVAYMGDDINDIEVMKNVGLSACPNDAIDEVKKNASYVCQKSGGQGCVREFINYINKN